MHAYLSRLPLVVFVLVSLFGCAHGPTERGTQVHRPSVGPRGRLEYDSAQLMMKSADQVNDLIQKRVKKAGDAQASQQVDYDAGLRSEPEAISYLRDALRVALSRPDQDGFRATAFSRLERELSDLNATAQVMRQLSDEGIGALQSDEAATNVKATYAILLENLMAELKPQIKTQPWAREIITNIRDARIEITEAVRKQQLMRSMARPVSPSSTAEGIIPSQTSEKN